MVALASIREGSERTTPQAVLVNEGCAQSFCAEDVAILSTSYTHSCQSSECSGSTEASKWLNKPLYRV